MIKRLLLIILTINLFACGGGGGSSDGDSDNNTNLGADRGLRIMHGEIDLEPLSIKLADGTLITQAEFAKSLRYFKIAEGTQTINLYRNSDSLSPLASSSLEVAAKGKYSLVVFGSRSGLGTGTKILTDGYAEEIPDGQVAVRIVHTTVGAADLDFRFNSQQAEQVSFGGNSEYFLQPLSASGTLGFSAVRSVDSRLIASQNLSLEPGKSYSLLITGEIGLFTLVRVFQD